MAKNRQLAHGDFLPKSPAPVLGSATPSIILIVDDNTDAGDALGLLLAHDGHQVKVVASGEAAIAIFSSYRSMVVLLDIGLPGMDGYEVARNLRGQFDWEMKIIAVTGYGNQETVARTKEAGFDAHLVKPLGIKKLREILG